MIKVVLTGGPCAGKSSVMDAISRNLKVYTVPEVATLLFSEGYPCPGKDCEWSPQWQEGFQRTVFQRQVELEQLALRMAPHGAIIVLDRGVADGAAYWPNGPEDFFWFIDCAPTQVYSLYTAVIHLESLAVGKPHLYGKAGNDARFEPLERAQALDEAIKMAWAGHPQRHVISSSNSLEENTMEVIKILQGLRELQPV